MSIKITNISYSYEEKPVIKHITCTFEPGLFYSLIGPNGSGKTTLIDLISGFLTPLEGEIQINRKPLLKLAKRTVAKKIALVSQDYAIKFPFRVKDIVMMGRHPYIPRFSHPGYEDYKKVDEVIETCDIKSLAERNINELSGGEMQRCIFARALCQDTPVLLLDEAFSSMDINHTLNLLSLIKQLVRQKNKIVISVFHDLNLAASWSDKILMMKNGEAKAFGESDKILTRENIKNVFNVSSIVTYNEHIDARQVCYPVQQ